MVWGLIEWRAFAWLQRQFLQIKHKPCHKKLALFGGGGLLGCEMIKINELVEITQFMRLKWRWPHCFNRCGVGTMADGEIGLNQPNHLVVLNQIVWRQAVIQAVEMH
jgi:hypothetical protein